MMRGAPPVHFTRKKAVEAALRTWTPPRLLRAMAQLAEASLDMRRNAALAEAIAQRTLLSIAVSARRREANQLVRPRVSGDPATADFEVGQPWIPLARQ